MMAKRKNPARISAVCAACCLWAIATMAQPQAYPSKPIRIIVPASAGGTTDITARLVAQKTTERFGQPVLVENRPGGHDAIGVEAVAKSAPDGYTVLLTAPAAVVMLPLLQKLPYNVDRDLAPVSLAVVTPLILVVHPSLPARTAKELIAYARARPGQLSYATTGNGGVQHLAGELLKITMKIDMVQVPYKGAGQVIPDLLGGYVPMFFSGMPPAMPHVRSGRLRALAVTTTYRSSAAPDVPTMQEAGVPGFDISNWFAFFVPAGTPSSVNGKLSAEINRSLKLPDVGEKLASAGADAVGTSPDELARFMRAESAKFADLIKASGIKGMD
jgi:tripartite-type tricarboxylate transporter receptor subunit TctC